MKDDEYQISIEIFLESASNQKNAKVLLEEPIELSNRMPGKHRRYALAPSSAIQLI
jgi:hypothetical protein